MVTSPERAPHGRSTAPDLAPSNAMDAALSVVAAANGHRTKAAFAARALRAVARLVAVTDEGALTEATGAPSDYSALLQVLARPEAVADLHTMADPDPLLPAHLAGLRAREHLLAAEGGAYTSAQMATALGITRQAVDNRRRHGRLLAVTLGRRGYRYPAWQIEQGNALPGLARVLAELHDLDPWTQLAFILNPNTWLDDETPLAVLRLGDLDRVREAASAYGAHVAA